MTEFIRWLFFHRDSVTSCKKIKKDCEEIKNDCDKKEKIKKDCHKKIVKRLYVNNRMNSVVMQMRPSRQF